jgi:hypothetical protein
MVNDSENIYIWNDADKKGFKMSLNAATEIASQSGVAKQYQDFSKEDVEKMYQEQGYTYNCLEASVADSEFVVPKDVVFSDMSAILEQTKKLQMAPGKTPSAADLKNYQEMMKEYQK